MAPNPVQSVPQMGYRNLDQFNKFGVCFKSILQKLTIPTEYPEKRGCAEASLTLALGNANLFDH